MEIFCNITYVFTVTFNQFNVSLLNKSIISLKKKNRLLNCSVICNDKIAPNWSISTRDIRSNFISYKNSSEKGSKEFPFQSKKLASFERIPSLQKVQIKYCG